MSDIGNLALRLIKERENSTKRYRKQGSKDGIVDAFKLSYYDFYRIQWFNGTAQAEDLFSMCASSQRKENVKKEDERQFDEMIESDDQFIYRLRDHMDVYCRGWADGVLEIWNKIKDKLDVEQICFIRGPNFGKSDVNSAGGSEINQK
jgi:hypothetical protein